MSRISAFVSARQFSSVGAERIFFFSRRETPEMGGGFLEEKSEVKKTPIHPGESKAGDHQWRSWCNFLACASSRLT